MTHVINLNNSDSSTMPTQTHFLVRSGEVFVTGQPV